MKFDVSKEIKYIKNKYFKNKNLKPIRNSLKDMLNPNKGLVDLRLSIVLLICLSNYGFKNTGYGYDFMKIMKIMNKVKENTTKEILTSNKYKKYRGELVINKL